jgi:Ankyrin repeats (many copies)
MVASKVGQLPLHAAAGGGCWRCVALLHNAAPKAAAVKDRRDQTPAQIAARRGHTVSPGCVIQSDVVSCQRCHVWWQQLRMDASRALKQGANLKDWIDIGRR